MSPQITSPHHTYVKHTNQRRWDGLGESHQASLVRHASKAGKNTVDRTVAGSIAEFKRNTCSHMGLGTGPRLHSECPFGSVFDEYHPSDSWALERTINDAYRQVYGNLPPTENERCTSLLSLIHI